MKTKILLFISLIFILGSCADNADMGKTTIVPTVINNEITVTDEQVEEKGNEMVEVKTTRVENILIGEFKKELAKNDAIVIDLRTSGELKNTGVIPGAKQIDFYASDFKNKLNTLDKDEKYLIYCQSGGRSGKTLSLMKKLGFTNVLELQGGMNNWLASGERTVKFNPKSMGMSLESNSNVMNNNMMMNSKVVTLNAKNWEFDQKVIKAKKGEKLIIKVNNTDVLHGIAIPELQVVGNDEIEVDTSKTGKYKFVCANYCGGGHSDMTGTLIIE